MLQKRVVIVADIDLSKIKGDIVRTVALASELKNNEFDITLITPRMSGNKPAYDLEGINSIQTSIKIRGGSVFNVLERTWSIIKEADKLRKTFKRDKQPTFMLETSIVGGYFAVSRFPEYILDVHGIYYSEIDYQSLPWYIPKGLYRRYNKYLEKTGCRKAEKIITVSNSMSKFIIDQFKVPDEKVQKVTNGYFELKIN